VDGPSHFIGGKAKGSTILKRRQLNTLDAIPVVLVPYWGSGTIGKDRGKKKEYLRTLLRFG
jgi:hypothetical protein